MIDEKGMLHCFFGYGDSQLLHDPLDIKTYLKPPILVTQKKITKQSLPSSQVRHMTPQVLTPSRNNKKMSRGNPGLDLNFYNLNEPASPLFSSSANIFPNIYPTKKDKIRNLKTKMGTVSNESTENFPTITSGKRAFVSQYPKMQF